MDNNYTLIEYFINSLKENHIIKIYTKGNNYMELIIYTRYEPLIICIPDIKKFGYLLTLYINALNNYYINIRKKQLEKDLSYYFNQLLLGMLDEYCLDFNLYLEYLSKNLNNDYTKKR